jgi:hypothetical protein
LGSAIVEAGECGTFPCDDPRQYSSIQWWIQSREPQCSARIFPGAERHRLDTQNRERDQFGAYQACIGFSLGKMVKIEHNRFFRAVSELAFPFGSGERWNLLPPTDGDLSAGPRLREMPLSSGGSGVQQFWNRCRRGTVFPTSPEKSTNTLWRRAGREASGPIFMQQRKVRTLPGRATSVSFISAAVIRIDHTAQDEVG